jgi:hypothetical protein
MQTAGQVECLDTLDENARFITLALASLAAEGRTKK